MGLLVSCAVFGEIQCHLQQIRNSTIGCQLAGLLGAPGRHGGVWTVLLRLPVREAGMGMGKGMGMGMGAPPVHRPAHGAWEGALLGAAAETASAAGCRRRENFHVGYTQGWFVCL